MMKKTSRSGPSLLLVTVLVAAALFSVLDAAAADTKMKDVMKKVGATTAGDDAKALAPLFSQAKGMVPSDADVAGMKTVFDTAIAAANAGDMAGAKAACKDCHGKFRDTYKTKFGSKAP